MHITSGYRTSEFNRKIGGSKTSRHIHGLAVDFTFDSINEEIAKKIWNMLKWNTFIDFQMIYYPDQHFIHVGLSKPGKPTEFLRKRKYQNYELIDRV